MKSLSQSEYGELRSLYQQVYAPKFETVLDELTDQEVDELTEEIIEEVVEEFFLECLEEGLDIGSVEETLCESLDTSITNLNETYLMEMNPYAPAGSKESKAYNKATTSSKRSADRAAKRKEVIGKVKKAVGKVGSALKAGADKAEGAARAGAKAAYKVASRAAGAAVGTVKKAASTAKSEFKKGYDSASKSSSSDSGSSDSGSSSSGSTRRAVGGAARKVGSLLKKGLKKAVGGAARAVSKGADKVATRLGEEYVDEATAMAKRGYDEAPIRQKIAKSTGGGEAADRASALEKKSTFGDANKAKQRQNLARTQRGDFRKTTSSSPGLHGYGHKATNDADRAKQAARGAQRGALTPAEKKQLNREELELDQMIESLVERGYTEQEAYALVAQFTLDEDAGIISGLAGLALGAKGASYAAKNTKRMRDYPKNFVKGIVDPRTYGSKKKKEQKEEYVGEAQEARNNPEKYEREQSKKYAPVRGEKTPMPPRGDKRREDFEKWYAAQRR